ncbi:MAG: very short patch repair endonuclease [Bacteroidota bacterium]
MHPGLKRGLNFIMDVHSPVQRSFNMSKISCKNTKPEILVRKWIWAKGYRYRLHRKDLPGKPDIVLPKYRAVIFVNGCFWHRHGCRQTTTPKSRKDFWLAKFETNIARDRRNIKSLMEKSWRVMIVWECKLRRKDADPEMVVRQITAFLNSDIPFTETV